MPLRTSSAASMNDEPRRLDFKPQSSKRNAPHPISKSFNLKTRGRECSLEALPSSMPATGPSWARAPPKHEVQAGRSNNGACMHGWMDGQMGICSYVYVYVCMCIYIYIYVFQYICTQVYIYIVYALATSAWQIPGALGTQIELGFPSLSFLPSPDWPGG